MKSNRKYPCTTEFLAPHTHRRSCSYRKSNWSLSSLDLWSKVDPHPQSPRQTTVLTKTKWRIDAEPFGLKAWGDVYRIYAIACFWFPWIAHWKSGMRAYVPRWPKVIIDHDPQAGRLGDLLVTGDGGTGIVIFQNLHEIFRFKFQGIYVINGFIGRILAILIVDTSDICQGEGNLNSHCCAQAPWTRSSILRFL